MVLKAKDWREDPYANVRREVPNRPGKVILSRKDYKRSRAKNEMWELIEESLEDLEGLAVELRV